MSGVKLSRKCSTEHETKFLKFQNATFQIVPVYVCVCACACLLAGKLDKPLICIEFT